MIVGGWEQCMLLEAWSSSFQMEAFKSFYDGNLFGASSNGEVEKVGSVEVDWDDEEWYAEESIDGIMCERLGIPVESTLVEAEPESELISDFCFIGTSSRIVSFTDYLLNPALQTPYNYNGQ
ncbi:hypothetical protein R1flu_015036 [Riccia fluitans]|uniref:Uncharacterized protein n=1 Tax=Riccia fluitans TaxID=41844 RepID=A0ABD1YI48_9MARC